MINTLNINNSIPIPINSKLCAFELGVLAVCFSSILYKECEVVIMFSSLHQYKKYTLDCKIVAMKMSHFYYTRQPSSISLKVCKHHFLKL